jgi:tRNA-splicing ligase RtcB
MKKIINTEKIPIKLWLDDLEDETLQQVKNIANIPYAYSHVAIMPDAHPGYGMPIGGVLATDGVIIPNAVGVDIGCGIIAARSELKDIDKQTIINWIERIKKTIPVGFSHHNFKQKWEGFERAPDIEIIQKELDSAMFQLGTLGGGNHFLELQRDLNGFLWFMIHSGSRNFGFKTAEFFHRKARKISDKWQQVLPDKELSFLPIDSNIGQEYFTAMKYCLEFAYANRKHMFDNITEIIGKSYFKEKIINIHHNYAAIENHFGKPVLVHRKGATLATKDTIGIIPGSQGARSYIVHGKGNPESFQSCSHGAGRKLGRNESRRKLNLEEEKRKMDKKGILHEVKYIKDLDEAPGAYKDIDFVMACQSDLVEIDEILEPIAVIKG